MAPSLPPLPPVTPEPPSRETDAFLAQSRAIQLTAQDRQEGYDVDLVHSTPRGRPFPTPALAPPGSPPLDALVEPIRKPEKGYGTLDGGAHELDRTPATHSIRGNGAVGRRVWYLRPLALVLITLLILALSLGLGLGVGLGVKHVSDEAASNANQTSSAVSNSAVYTSSVPVSTRSNGEPGIPVANTIISGQSRPSNSFDPSPSVVLSTTPPASPASTGTRNVPVPASSISSSRVVPSGATNLPIPASETVPIPLTVTLITSPPAKRAAPTRLA